MTPETKEFLIEIAIIVGGIVAMFGFLYWVVAV